MSEPAAGETAERQGQTAVAVARQAGGIGGALIVGNALRYVSAFFAARALGAAGFGVYMLANTIASFLRIVGTAGLSPGVLPFLSKARSAGSASEVRAVVRASMMLAGAVSTGLALGVFIGAPALALHVFDDPPLEPALRLFAGLIVLGGVTAVVRALLLGFGAIWEQEWLERVVVVGVTCGVLGLSWAFGLGMEGAALAHYLGFGVALSIGWFLLSRRIPERGTEPAAPPITATLFAHSWPLMGTTMLGFVLLWSDILFVGYFEDLETVGVYGAAARLAAAAIAAQEALGPILLARVAEHHVKGEREELAHLYHLAVRWAMWPSLAISIVLFVWAPGFLAIFGAEFVDGVVPMRLLLAAKVVATLTGMPARMYAVMGLQRQHLFNMALLFLGNVVLNCLWIPRFGAAGAAAATATSLGVIRVVQTFQLQRLRGVLPWGRRSLRPIGCMVPLACGAWLLRELGTEALWGFGWILSAVVFFTAVGAIVLLLDVRPEDRELFAAIRRRAGRSSS